MAIRTQFPELAELGSEAEPRTKPDATLLHWAYFMAAAAWRRKVLVIAVLLAGIAAMVAYYQRKTPMYRVEASILVQRTPFARQASEDIASMRSAYELVHRRENLVNLIKEAKIPIGQPAQVRARSALESWLPSSVTRLMGRSRPDDDPLSTAVLELDRALQVRTGDGTITITLDWPDPQQAYDLVEAAQQNFLEARHVHEITAIDEVISMLQGRTAMLRRQLDSTIDEVQRGVREAGSRDQDSSMQTSVTPRGESEDLVRLRSMLEAKERAIGDVEEFRRRRLADLQAQLDEKRGIYSETYPAVVTLKQDIQALSRESPQVIALREEARALREQYRGRLNHESRRATTSGMLMPRTATGQRPSHAVGPGSSIDDDERVRGARAQYQQMIERLHAAQVDLDTARAAFKHRYNIIWPAEVPKEPFSPDPRKVFGLGSVATLALALLIAAAPDLLSGRIVQRWQVEQTLQLPILVEFRRK